MGNNISIVPKNKKFGSIYKTGSEPVRPGYYKNMKKVLYQGEELKLDPDETEFHKLKYGYAKTNKKVYYQGKPIISADHKTFNVINRKNIKNITQIPEYISLNSVLGVDYINNKKRIYYRGVFIHEE